MATLKLRLVKHAETYHSQLVETDGEDYSEMEVEDEVVRETRHDNGTDMKTNTMDGHEQDTLHITIRTTIATHKIPSEREDIGVFNGESSIRKSHGNIGKESDFFNTAIDTNLLTSIKQHNEDMFGNGSSRHISKTVSFHKKHCEKWIVSSKTANNSYPNKNKDVLKKNSSIRNDHDYTTNTPYTSPKTMTTAVFEENDIDKALNALQMPREKSKGEKKKNSAIDAVHMENCKSLSSIEDKGDCDIPIHQSIALELSPDFKQHSTCIKEHSGRPRGRPRKEPLAPEITPGNSLVHTSPPPKHSGRPRGRPRKIIALEHTSPTLTLKVCTNGEHEEAPNMLEKIGRPRGRPRKIRSSEQKPSQIEESADRSCDNEPVPMNTFWNTRRSPLKRRAIEPESLQRGVLANDVPENIDKSDKSRKMPKKIGHSEQESPKSEIFPGKKLGNVSNPPNKMTRKRGRPRIIRHSEQEFTQSEASRDGVPEFVVEIRVGRPRGRRKTNEASEQKSLKSEDCPESAVKKCSKPRGRPRKTAGVLKEESNCAEDENKYKFRSIFNDSKSEPTELCELEENLELEQCDTDPNCGEAAEPSIKEESKRLPENGTKQSSISSDNDSRDAMESTSLNSSISLLDNSKPGSFGSYACSYCDYRTWKRLSFYVHLRLVHRTLPVLVCSHCKYLTFSTDKLTAHVNSKHA